jgi:hypothetical protein
LSNEMMKSLPTYLRNSDEFIQTLNAEGKKVQLLNSDIHDIQNQLSVDTATWGIEIYERELGIPIATAKPLAERRSVVKSKLRGTGKLDATLVKIVADAYTNGEVEVSYDGKINIKFTAILGIPPNLDDLKNALDDIKPAHKEVIYLFAYLLIKDIHGVMTISEIETTQLNKFAGGV